MEERVFGEFAVSELLASRMLYMARRPTFCFTRIRAVTLEENAVALECGRLVKRGDRDNESVSTEDKRIILVPKQVKVFNQTSEQIFYFSFEPWNNQGVYEGAIAHLKYRDLIRSILLERK